jgi:hypothetical protein
VLPRGTDRELTMAQLLRLDEMTIKHPDARVVGWHKDGPLIRNAGRVVRMNGLGRLSLAPRGFQEVGA